MTKSIICPSCNGTGRRALSRALSETMRLFSGQKARSAPELAALDNSSSNSMNNRLEALRRLGFLTRYRQGARYLYLRAAVPSRQRRL